MSDEKITDRLIRAAKGVLKRIDFDVNGILLPAGFHGGNGGLVSRETIAACDELRRALASVDEADE